MKKSLSLLLSLVMLLTLLAPAASAAETATITEQYAQVDGQYQTSIWMYSQYCYEEAYGADAVVVDVDGDGKLEVITAAYTLTVADAATGNVKWQVENPGAGSKVFCDFVVTDLEGDGAKEIVIGYGTGSVNVINGKTGSAKAGWPQNVSPWGDGVRSLAVDDIDGDGKKEVIVGLGAGNSESLYVYGCDGSPKPGCISSGVGAYCDGIWGNGITTGDLDNDGLPEIIMPTDNWFVNAFNADGSPVMAGSAFGKDYPWCQVGIYEDYQEELEHKNGGWGLSIEYESLAKKGRKGTFGPSMGGGVARYVDVDGDGKKEVVVSVLMMDRSNYFLAPAGTRDWTIGSKDSQYMTVAIYNQDHTRFNNGKYNWEKIPTDQAAGLGKPLYYDAGAMTLGVESVPVVADINGDGVNEILFNAFDGKVHCFSLSDSQHELAGWPYTLPKTTGSAFELPSEVVCADLNGDGKQEVIFGSVVKNSSAQPCADGTLYIVGSDGKLVASQPLHHGIEESGVNTINSCMSAPAVSDVDKDGKYEILVNTTKYGLCCYEVTMASGKPEQPAQSPAFTDVPANQFYAEPVAWAVENGITTGTSKTTFSPDDLCTEIQILTFLWRAAGKTEVDVTLPFAVTGSAYTKAAKWAYSNGMIDASFNPDAPCTRATAVKFIWQAFGTPEAAASNFVDVPADKDYAKAVDWAVANGVTKGKGKTTFKPDDTCTRGEIVTFLHRAYVK